ncbi:MAG TPA: disulfide bond formation protein B [Stellaceae bacterium]|nr:disulfide bond formation protein B [Stellaceae bacterium]
MPLVILVASVALVGGALLFQYVGGLQPCELCLYQRWPYYAMIVLSALALAAGRLGLSAAVTGVAALAFLVGAGLAFYHVGVEQHWFAGPGACTGTSAGSGSIEDFRKQLMAQQPVRCDEPQWTLFGVSLAGWNLLASLALVVFCLLALRRPALSRRTA